jgi:hypothetical protein
LSTYLLQCCNTDSQYLNIARQHRYEKAAMPIHLG